MRLGTFMKKFFNLFTAVILGVCCLVAAACSGSSEGQALQIDSQAPEFTLMDLNGQEVNLADFRGKTLLINFWATTCGPCVTEMPVFQEFTNSLDGNTAFVAIDIGEDPNLVKEFIRNNGYTFQVLLDSQGEVARKYNIRYTPTSIFLDSKGLMKINMIGPFKNKESINKQLAGILP
jgi:peroxiredoxin